MNPAVIAIASVTDVARAACGGCMHSAAGPVCRVDRGEACDAPALVGSPEQLARVMAALDTALGSEGDRGSRFVQALRLSEGEAELTLAVQAHCGGLELADTAFQTLRHLLPDTDIYVLHGQA